MSDAAAAKRPYLDLSRVSLPTQVRIDDHDLEVSELSDRHKLLIVDLARIDKEINDAEFNLRTLRAAKNELSRLFAALNQANGNQGDN